MGRIEVKPAGQRGGVNRRSPDRRLRPMVMALEGRALLSTIVVDNPTDTPLTGQTDLRQAINQANADGGGDTIVFDAKVFAKPQQIVLNNTLELTGTARATTITGPAAGVTVSGEGASRVFQVDPGVTASISGLTISGGSTSGKGGGLYNDGGNVTLANCTISQSYAATGGGGLAIFGGTATLTNCTISGNIIKGAGGGLNVNGTSSNPGAVKLINCTVSGNYAYNGGGVLIYQYGGATLTNCTISGNTASPRGTNHGGGLFNLGTVTLINCTVSSNTGSGLYNAGTATLTNTIVAGNGGDIANVGNVSGNYNLIGDGSGISGGTGNLTGDPKLAPLDDYGGPTQTMALLPGSPAIGAGTADGAQTTDQRNEPRTGHVDIGAFQSQGFTLTPASGSTPQTVLAGAVFRKPLAVTVTANNPVEPVDGGGVSFAAPTSGPSATLSAATATIQSGQAAVTATANDTAGGYNVTATAAGASSAIYSLTNTQTLASTDRTPNAAVVQDVDSLASLRAAIAYANSHPGPDTITFEPAVSGKTPRTIKLIGGPLVLTDPATTTIVGPGATRLTIKGDGKSRLFDVEGGSLALSRMTITGGNAGKGNGGGIRNDGGKLWLNDVVLRGNRARKGGGLFNDGTTTLADVVLRGNTARRGPGLFSTRHATLRRRGLSSPRSTGQILSDAFNATGGVPKNWMQILDASGVVEEKPHDLTITDSNRKSTGIVSTLPKSVFNPVGVVTINQAQINGVNPAGNAIFGLIGLSSTGSLTGYLAAGIDEKGHVFIVEQDPSIKQTIVPLGTDKSYKGGSILIKFNVDLFGLEVRAPGFDSGKVLFSDPKLNNFSLAAAFSNGAIPALVAASQPGTSGVGSASFGSITVSTA
jgi:hypothetical protein